MAKAKAQSKHSRAARRAASPSLDLDKSLTTIPRAEKTVLHRESILTDRANAGVSKKQSKSKAKSRSQRLRQQKGIERAEVVFDQMEKKVADSVGRAKSVKSRRADWEDLNRKTSKSMFEALNTDPGNEDDDVMIDDSAPAKKSKSKTRLEHIAQNPVVDEHPTIDEDDEIT